MNLNKDIKIELDENTTIEVNIVDKTGYTEEVYFFNAEKLKAVLAFLDKIDVDSDS